MKTKRRSEQRSVIELAGLDRVTIEQLRASLRGGPFLFTCAQEKASGDAPDLRVVSVELLAKTVKRAAPVIACGPPGALRGAFLAGCADYLREPWTPVELAHRARAVLDRERELWRFPWGSISIEGGTLVTPSGSADLTHHEEEILRMLLHNRGTVVSRADLGYAVAPRPGRAASRAPDMHVAALRRKIRAAVPGAGRLIESVKGQGYLIR